MALGRAATRTTRLCSTEWRPRMRGALPSREGQNSRGWPETSREKPSGRNSYVLDLLARNSTTVLVHRFYEPVRNSWALRRRDFERRLSFMMRDIVRAPIIVDTTTIARFFASSGLALSI